MKKIFCIVMIFVFVLGALACSSPAAEESTAAATQEATVSQSAAEVVVFADPVLEKRVREQMGKPEGDITIAEAEAVTELDLENKDNASEESILDLSGLESFKNVKKLTISLNNISDLSPIAGMNLEVFYSMNGNPNIKDFSPLAGSTNMLDMNILGNDNINDSNIAFIAGMTDIELFWIQGAKDLTDISAVANFKKMARFNIDDSGVSDISPAAGLTSIVEMDLSGTKVSDVSPLAGLTNLKSLKLEGSLVTDYSPIADIYPNLTDKDFEIE